MNLELLDPFGRQIPDRIDSTLSLPPSLHFRPTQSDAAPTSSTANNKSSSSTATATASSSKKTSQAAGGTSASTSASKKSSSSSSGKRGAAAASASAGMAAVVEDLEWKAAYHVSYNRRGTYLAVGYGSSTVAVFSTLSRTLSSLYQSDAPDLRPGNIQDGVTSLTWSRRSRTLLCGAAGDAHVRLYDTTHHFGPDQACRFALERPMVASSSSGGAPAAAADGTGGADPDDPSATLVAPAASATKTPKSAAKSRSTAGNSHDAGAAASEAAAASHAMNASSSSLAIVPNRTLDKTRNTSFADPGVQFVYVSEGRAMVTAVWEMGSGPPPPPPPPPPAAAGGGDVDDGDESQPMEVEEPLAGKERPRRRSASARARHSVAVAAATATVSSIDAAPAAADARPPKASGRDAQGPGQQQIEGGDNAHGDKVTHNRAPQKHPCVSLEFDHPVGGALQVNPRISTAGLAALTDGTLVLFYVPADSFVSNDHKEETRRFGEDVSRADASSEPPSPSTPSPPPLAWIVPLIGPGVRPKASGSSGSQPPPWITCASFDHRGDNVFAATKDGTLFGFQVQPIWAAMQQHWHSSTRDGIANPADASGEEPTPSTILPVVEPHVRLSIGGSTAWHLLVSRNGKDLVVNSSDGALRLFKVADLMMVSSSSTALPSKPQPPRAGGAATSSAAVAAIKPMVFQDVVNKVKFACCDLSGDGEHLVGGANGDDTKYRLYLWSTATGVLLDKLTGPPLQLYSVAWHPSRSFVAVATSDGLVDVWGPRVNWTAFAPDFQALPHNVEYVEREDEFDVDEAGRYLVETLPSSSTARPGDGGRGGGGGGDTDDDENAQAVDVTTIEKVPVFASDSEEEEDVFHYDVRLVNLLAERKGKYRDKSLDMAD